jgi:Tol biopolymer transport system component
MFWKLNHINQKRDIIILAFVAAVMVSGGNATADFVFSEPTNLGPPVNTSYAEGAACISADGLSLYFQSNRFGGAGEADLWVATRDTIDDEWAPPRNLGPTVNTSNYDGGPRISADGLELYFASNRPGGYGRDDIWVTRRATTDDDWGEPENLGPTVNSPAEELLPSVSADGLELYFSEFQDARPGGYGGADVWVTKRPTKDDPWGTPENLGDTVNGGDADGFPFISADGLKLYFNSTRAGGYGGIDIWVTTRATKDADWGSPVNLGPTINSTGHDFYPSLSANGSTLYFSSDRPGGSGRGDIWQVPIIPIVDFNGDSIVDCVDICMLVDYWETDEPLYDIGPMPWGDGIVDVQDLIVLAETLTSWGREPGRQGSRTVFRLSCQLFAWSRIRSVTSRPALTVTVWLIWQICIKMGPTPIDSV